MDYYLTAFPFVGSRLEVITVNGVRYEGQLANAEAAREIITLIKVTDYGTEDRRVMLPQPANGALPEHERLHLFDRQITSLKVLDEPAFNGVQPPPPVPQAPPNGQAPPPAPPAPQVNGIGGGGVVGGGGAPVGAAGRRSTGGGTPTDPRQPPQQPAAPTSDTAILEALKEHGVCNYDQLKMMLNGAKRAAEGGGEGTSRQQPPEDGEASAPKQMRTAEKLMERLGHKERSPPFPLYSIAQLQQHGQVVRAIAVLFNEEECPKEPVYIRIDTQHLPTAPMLTQLWRVRDYTWRDGGSTRSCNLISRHYKTGMDGLGEVEFARVNGGRPWLVNGHLAYQAQAIAGQVELVSDVQELKTRTGRIKSITSSSNGARSVEVDVRGAVSGFRLGPSNYHGNQTGFNMLEVGDEVEVDMIRLPVGCLVGAKYVLPNVDFHRERPPFMPKADEPTVESGTGEYLPWRIKTR